MFISLKGGLADIALNFKCFLAANIGKTIHGTSKASEKIRPRVPTVEGISISIPDVKPIGPWPCR